MELIQSFTPEAFVGYSALGAVLIVPTVELLRTHFLKKLDGVFVVLLSIGVGAIYGALGSLVGYLEGGVTHALAFGAWAGILASGSNKYIDSLAKKS